MPRRAWGRTTFHTVSQWVEPNAKDASRCSDRNRQQHFPRDRDDEGHHHDGQHDAGGKQADAVERAAEDRQESHRLLDEPARPCCSGTAPAERCPAIRRSRWARRPAGPPGRPGRSTAAAAPVSARKIAVPIPSGVAIRSARMDVTIVPKIKGSAPKSPATGSQFWRDQETPAQLRAGPRRNARRVGRPASR